MFPTAIREEDEGNLLVLEVGESFGSSGDWFRATEENAIYARVILLASLKYCFMRPMACPYSNANANSGISGSASEDWKRAARRHVWAL